MQREFSNTFIYILIDCLACAGGFLVNTTDEACNLPLRAWLMILAFISLCSAIYHGILCYEVKRYYIRKSTVRVGYAFELLIFAWFCLGQWFYYAPSNCVAEAPILESILINLIVLLYVRLLRIISLLFFCVLCGPMVLIVSYCCISNDN